MSSELSNLIKRAEINLREKGLSLRTPGEGVARLFDKLAGTAQSNGESPEIVEQFRGRASQERQAEIKAARIVISREPGNN